MNSIYPQPFLNQLVYQPGATQEQRKKNVLHYLHVSKFIVSNAKQTIEAFKKRNIRLFDPLVRDRCCQVHALCILELFQDQALYEELKNLETQVQTSLILINRKTSKAPLLPDGITFAGMVEAFGIALQASDKACLLFQAHLLTVGTTLHQPRTIEYSILRDKFARSLAFDSVKQMVSYARTAFSENAIAFIRKTAAELQGIEDEKRELLQARLRVVRRFEIKDKEGNHTSNLRTPLASTCMLYNMQTVLLKAREERFLLLFEEFRRDKIPPKRLFFRFEGVLGAFKRVPHETVGMGDLLLVFKTQLSTGMTEEVLSECLERERPEEVVLAAITAIEQFVVDDDLTDLDAGAREEIASYAEKAKALQKQGIEAIVHAYPALTVGGEGI